MAMEKQLTPTNHVLTLLHINRTVLLVRLTPPILPPTLTRQQGSLGKVVMALPQHFRFLGIALYGFIQYKLPLNFSR
jgi:hypothetical protein